MVSWLRWPREAPECWEISVAGIIAEGPGLGYRHLELLPFRRPHLEYFAQLSGTTASIVPLTFAVALGLGVCGCLKETTDMWGHSVSWRGPCLEPGSSGLVWIEHWERGISYGLASHGKDSHLVSGLLVVALLGLLNLQLEETGRACKA
ncbi:hypothetical protein NDU88_000534 [Pleurodeles waltl]|uniref:Uncharacterized protein n=1 Tax=Pleurodeles waltl TaxID=8319 RepID=A0AAV7V5C2_PLEWA|nr:hypothetical protein NDU88_000534 [Pleurodeles waltl]